MTEVEAANLELSKREQEVAEAYSAGQSYKEIARDLGVSPTTVRSHLRTIFGKLGVTSKIELARSLNENAPQESPRDTAAAVADMALELDDAARRERSLATVLRIISDQDGELDAVIDAVLDHALEICEAEYGHLFEYHGDFMFSEMRSRGISPAFAAWLSEMGIFRVEPTTGVGRAAAELKPASIADIRAGGLYETGSPLRVASVDFGKARSLAAIPMMSGNRLIGVFSVYRTRVHPFNERALELVQLFADQAAIAIENVRRFRQLQARVERDAATREILQVLSESRDDESPVFDAILENACKLCDAPLAYLSMVTEDRTHVVSPARRGAFESFGKTLDKLQVPLDTSPLALARAIAECRVFREDDISDSDVYRNGDPNRVSMVEDERARSLLVVPLIHKGLGIGSITLYRREVAPFSDEDVALVEGFAAQAVIAIENVQQFRELQVRLERQAATREVLDAISVSRTDEGPVFDAILANARRLCGAPAAALILGREGDPHQVMAAQHGAIPDVIEVYRNGEIPMDPQRSDAARAILERRVVHFHDMKDTEDYRLDVMKTRLFVDQQGIRTNLMVPLVSDNAGIGCLILFRDEVRPYSDDEIALVKTFATQAVIAIENVQQFRALESLNAELGERVDEQVGEIERMGRLKRFLSPAVADALVTLGDESILASHRALIATLFCDIRGFTAFCETAEPEETIEVLQAYHEEMGTLISAHGAGVDKRMGDGIMVIFNDPFPCDDPAGEAVRLAVAMRERMATLCQQWKRHGHRLGFGVGISLGYATIGMVGSEGRYDYTASGTAVNLAARLCDRAEDGEILLSPRAYTAIEDDFRAESSGELSLKGIREPVEVFRLVTP